VRYVIVCGSRDFARPHAVRGVLEALPRDIVLVHGDCPTGADRLADEIGKELGFHVIPCPADWDKHGRAAGPIRNQMMLETYKPFRVIAFPCWGKPNKGTNDMIARAKKAGIDVRCYC
jgi:hypothetical protein